MKYIAFAIGAGIFATLSSFATSVGAPSELVEIKDAQGKSVGSAQLSPNGKQGVLIVLNLKGLSPGPHGIHIHENGKCEGPDFKTAGGHFNPEKKKHGLKSPEGPHGGDLMEIIVGKDGSAKTILTSAATTLGEGSHSLIKAGGTSLVIHAKSDDQKTDPSGNSGDRIACGVIGK